MQARGVVIRGEGGDISSKFFGYSLKNEIIFFFLWLNNIPMYICATSSLSIPLLMGI